jgi:hypothetical protein
MPTKVDLTGVRRTFYGTPLWPPKIGGKEVRIPGSIAARPCKKRKDGAPTSFTDACEIKSLGHPPALAVDHSATPVPGHRGPQKNDEAYNARMASLYREVVLKEKPAVAENGFIPLGALGKANGNGAHAAKPEVAEPVSGD